MPATPDHGPVSGPASKAQPPAEPLPEETPTTQPRAPTPPADGAAECVAEVEEGTSAVAGLSLAVQIDGIRLVLLNDFNGRAVPLACATLSPLHLSGSGTVAHVMVEAELGLVFDLYVGEASL